MRCRRRRNCRSVGCEGPKPGPLVAPSGLRVSLTFSDSQGSIIARLLSVAVCVGRAGSATFRTTTPGVVFAEVLYVP